MTSGGARVGVGTRFTYDGEIVEVVEMKPGAAGNEVVVRSVTGQSYRRLPLKELLFSDRARLIPDMAGPSRVWARARSNDGFTSSRNLVRQALSHSVNQRRSVSRRNSTSAGPRLRSR